MSAQSRALKNLADHFDRLALEHSRQFADDGPPLYTGSEHFNLAADMARRTADELTWHNRFYYQVVERPRMRWSGRRLRKLMGQL